MSNLIFCFDLALANRRPRPITKADRSSRCSRADSEPERIVRSNCRPLSWAPATPADSSELTGSDLARLVPSERIEMTPEQLLAFWNALQEPPKPLTPAQRELGRLMRGES